MNIALIGYGKMGRMIEQIALERGHKIVCVVDIDNHNDINSDAFRSADVAIEFTAPTSAYQNVKDAFAQDVKVVSGSTGWMNEHGDEMKKLCEQGLHTLFWSSNFSVGVALFNALNTYLAKLMNKFPSYDVKIEETHHIHKLDAPSGTALTLAKDILKEHPEYTSWVLDEGKVEAGELPVKAKREGEVPGIHSVTYKSSVDEIQIYHSAYSRDGFAQGAVMAAEFLMGKKGVFGMEDLIKIKDEN